MITLATCFFCIYVLEWCLAHDHSFYKVTECLMRWWHFSSKQTSHNLTLDNMCLCGRTDVILISVRLSVIEGPLGGLNTKDALEKNKPLRLWATVSVTVTVAPLVRVLAAAPTVEGERPRGEEMDPHQTATPKSAKRAGQRQWNRWL